MYGSPCIGIGIGISILTFSINLAYNQFCCNYFIYLLESRNNFKNLQGLIIN
jgi:hypothetical protein